MPEYQKLALDTVRDFAKIYDKEQLVYLDQICRPFKLETSELIQRVLQKPVTINFHMDRISGNGKLVIENLLEEGKYQGQFSTGTTNGGKSAYIGGDRFLWEQRLFHNVYPDEAVDRPKYGALNIFRYRDGAAVRFGSCFLTLKKEIVERCTFSYGDSSTNPDTLCTSDTFAGVIADLLEDVENHERLLNQGVSSLQEALAILMDKSCKIKNMGRNLDYCIEVHVHGEINLKEDVDSIFIDASYENTKFEGIVRKVCQRYDMKLQWIPERRLACDDIGTLFRGRMVPVLAKKIDCLFGQSQGIINANLIGQASRHSIINPSCWEIVGDKEEVFQCMKQLWHTVGYFG